MVNDMDTCGKCKHYEKKGPGFGRCMLLGGVVPSITPACDKFGTPGCFISTAVCKTLNKPDDCYELNILRKFRDSFMQQSDTMRNDVQTYYQIAPEICRAIDDSDKGTYTLIWEKYLENAVKAIVANENQLAYDIYKTMVLDMKSKYLG
jgi:hypothetical protein